MFHLLDELHEMINNLRKQYQSAVPVTEDNLKELHAKVTEAKDAFQGVNKKDQQDLLSVGETTENAVQAISQTDASGTGQSAATETQTG